MTVASYSLNFINLSTNLGVSVKGLLKLLNHVEVYNQCLMGVSVKFSVRKLFRVAPADSLYKPNGENDQTVETILNVKQVLL